MSRSGSARLALCALGCLLAFAGGCDDTAAAPTLEVQIIDGQGHNPLAPDSPVDRLRVTVSREGVEPLVYDAPVTAGSFDASVPLGSLVDPLSVQVELRAGDEVRLVGASPRFVPARSGGLLRVPVVPPGTCVTMPIANLAVARDGVSWGRVGDLVLFPEGVDDDHPSEGRVEVFDLVRAAMGPMPDPPLALAEGFIKALSDTKALVQSSSGAFLFDTVTAELTPLPFEPASSPYIVSLPDAPGVFGTPDGAVLVGGQSEQTGGDVPTVVWVGPNGAVTETALAHPRYGPAIWALGPDSALVIGGDSRFASEHTGPGETLPISAELIRRDVPVGVLIDEPFDYGGRNYFPRVVVSLDGAQALLLGGFDGLGHERPDTRWLRGCPDHCVSEAGPSKEHVWDWGTIDAASALLVGATEDADVIEQVVFSADGPPRFVVRAHLTRPRIRAGVVPISPQMVWIFGGETIGPPGSNTPEDGADSELCALAPVSP
ncbi:MAG: hypothetical protein KC543_12205 [Myxococcales bacterium]|nr:hypothetical protein [Myxococcales bacterium]